MKPDAHLPSAHHKLLAFGLAALLACVVGFATSNLVASAATSRSSPRAQKLARALRACKKQPRNKRAACRRRAEKKYGTHHSTTPAPPATPVTTPTPPVTTPTPPAGPAAPPGPTLAWLQQQLCASPACDANNVISNLTILAAGTPRLGTGISTQQGGDGVPSDTWIYPLLYSYDQANQIICSVATSYCTPGSGAQFTYYTETTHWRAKSNAQLDSAGQWVLRGQAASTTCDPDPIACAYLNFGGGA